MSRAIDVHSRVGQGRGRESRSVEAALAEMDAEGVECAWICPTDVYAAVRNREGNEFIAETVAAHPDRFVGCAVANPWFGNQATDELHRAFESGLRVLFLYPPVQGFQLPDTLVDPLVEVALEYQAPIYAHTGTPICAMPFQLAALARRYPGGKFIMGHMGFADFWHDGAAAAATTDNIWLETSLIDCDVITDAVRQLGPERFLFGSAAPFSAIAPELQKIASLIVPQDAIEMILCHNAKGLLL